ncbi:hypothetical protein ASF43_19605 [Pseudorhodoferax sp. Leaf267]|nr:hypothetical protein ASF43_19605 [Pseudorhodoferax sp. Leaf267]
MKLPSSRALGADLGIARNTVTQVYEQLLGEGYVHAQTGSGTYVADTSPHGVLDGGARPGRRALRDHQRLSRRGRRTIEMAGVGKRQWGAFMPGVPDVTEFPLKTWNRLQNRMCKQIRPELMTYAPGGGYRPLRRALADYLRVTRAAHCQPEQVIVTTGIHQSVDLAIRLLCDVGDEVWVEEPCYWGIRNLLLSSGLKLVPIPVDAEGMNPGPRQRARPPRLIICTPSHQRSLYAERRALLLAQVRARYGERLPVLGGESGLHMVLALPHLKDDLAVAQAALESGVLVRALSGYYSSARAARNGLLLGYASVPPAQIGPAFETLAQVIDGFG